MKKSTYFPVLCTLIIAIIAPSSLFAQMFGLGKRLSEYKASNGITYHIGDTIKLGQGSASNGTFRYVQYGGWQVFFISGNGADDHNIEKTFSGYAVTIRKIHSFNAHGVPKVVFAVDIGKGSNFDLWIEDAITSCEIANCTGQGSNKPVVVQQRQDDNLDKLKKLKALLDAGAITGAEYNEQKKKLLNQ